MSDPRDIMERLRERDEFAQAAAHLRIDPDDLIYRDAAAEIMSFRQRVAELEAALVSLHDSAHGVIDEIRIVVDRAVYEGGMNAVESFREVSGGLFAIVERAAAALAKGAG